MRRMLTDCSVLDDLIYLLGQSFRVKTSFEGDQRHARAGSLIHHTLIQPTLDPRMGCLATVRLFHMQLSRDKPRKKWHVFRPKADPKPVI